MHVSGDGSSIPSNYGEGKPENQLPIEAESDVQLDFTGTQGTIEQENDKSPIEQAAEFVRYMTKSTVDTFSGAENAGDWLNKQNYIASSVIANGFDMERLGEFSEAYAFMRDSKAEGPKFIQSDTLSSDEEREARIYALGLLSQRLETNASNIPDYGDVRQYYNEGSMLDWLLTHPVSFGLNYAMDKTGADWYDTFSREWLGHDGMFTPLNVPSYIHGWIADDNEYGIRDDRFTDMLQVRSSDRIKADLVFKQELFSRLEGAIDDPEQFSYLYYLMTDGVNFSSDNVMAYKTLFENGEKTAPLETIIGRDYISEDFAKNAMGTDIAFEVNKTVGTKLLTALPFGMPLAGAINVGVTMLEEKTQNDDSMTTGEVVKMILKEGFARPFAISFGEYIKDGEALKPFLDKGVADYVSPEFFRNIVYGTTAETSYTAVEAAGDAIDGNFSQLAGDGAELAFTPKGVAKAIFKTAFGALKSTIFGK